MSLLCLQKRCLSLICLFSILLIPSWISAQDKEKRYVGSKACKECHEEEYDRFQRFAKKSHSFESILRMKKGLTGSELKTCYECHTTGYGRPGGFVSEEETPELMNTGCEVCHGPGSAHIKSEDPADIKTEITMEDCTTCHNKERVKAFNFKPLIYGGAH